MILIYSKVDKADNDHIRIDVMDASLKMIYGYISSMSTYFPGNCCKYFGKFVLATGLGRSTWYNANVIRSP